jgi:hypothetical protein
MTPHEIQQALIESGQAIDPVEMQSATIGESTTTAIACFQAHHIGPDGHPLHVDGIVGPNTAWALEHPRDHGAAFTAVGWRCSPSDADEPANVVLKVAVGEIGVYEDPEGSNRGARVDKYLGWEGQNPNVKGPPWCAYYVSWCWSHADGGSPFGRLGSAWKLNEWARAKNKFTDAPVPGDIFTIMRTTFRGHVGIVAAILPEGKIATVEGNSGGAVRALVRPVSSITTFIHPGVSK